MIFFIILIFGIAIFSTVMIIRVDLVYKMRIAALNMVSKRAKDIIDYGEGNFHIVYAYFDSLDSYDKMVYSFTKWKFDDFYPNFEKNLMAIGRIEETKCKLTVVK